MRRRAKPGGEVAGGDGKADRKGPRGAMTERPPKTLRANPYANCFALHTSP